jgi:CBS domain-containing protein
MTFGDLLSAERIRVGLGARTVREGFSELLDLVTEGRGSGATPLSLPAADGNRKPMGLGHTRLLTVVDGKEDSPWAALGIAPGVLEEPSDLTGEHDGVKPPRILVLLGGGDGLTPEGRYRILSTLAEPEVEGALLAAAGAAEVLGVEALTSLELQRPLRVEDVMVPLSYRVYPETPASEVLDLIARRRLEVVPVVDRNLQVLGLVSSGDALQQALRRKGAARGGGAPGVEGAHVRDIMTRSILCVSEDQPILDAAQLMANRKVKQLPVVREGELVGFLTREGVLFALSGEAETRSRVSKPDQRTDRGNDT